MKNKKRRPKKGNKDKFKKNNQWDMKVIFSLLFLIFIFYAVFILDESMLFIIAYVLMSFVTFFIYGVDKDAAEKSEERISEKTLLRLSLFCGWPGALLGRKLFNHKTRKKPFKYYLWATIIINISIFVWILKL